MATFTNQATLIFNGQSTTSNVTTGELANGLSLTKTSISLDYGRDDHVAYIVTVVNAGGTITDATLTDDLGSYIVGANTLTPLDYVEGSFLYYVNGVLTEGPTALAGPPLTVTGINIPTGASVQIIYEAATNEYTPHTADSSVTNTASLVGTGLIEPLSDDAVITARNEVSLTIAKAMCPTTVTEDGTLNYTFIIQNTGNTAVVETDDLIVTDTFNPILNPITVELNGVALTEGTQYTYDGTTGEFATLPGALTVPAAEYTQDPTSGVYSMAPGVTILTVSGTV